MMSEVDFEAIFGKAGGKLLTKEEAEERVRNNNIMQVPDMKTAYTFVGIVHSEAQRLGIPVRTIIKKDDNNKLTAKFITYTQKEHSDLMFGIASEWNEIFAPNSSSTKMYQMIKAQRAEEEMEQNL